MKGLVHIYTGDGKGKTTAAVGLGVRAAGRGRKVLLVQFLKGLPSGEIDALARLGPQFEIKRGQYLSKFVDSMTDEEKAQRFAPKLRTELAALGVEVVPGSGEDSGLHGIWLQDGQMQGAADPRREGTYGQP